MSIYYIKTYLLHIRNLMAQSCSQGVTKEYSRPCLCTRSKLTVNYFNFKMLLAAKKEKNGNKYTNTGGY